MLVRGAPRCADGVTEHDIGLALDAIDRGILDDSGIHTGQYYTAKYTPRARSDGLANC